MPSIGIGCAFLIECGPGEDQKHLHVLITHKCADGNYLAVSVQTAYPGEYYDSSCFFSGGEHPFISHSSWVPYKRAAILSHAGLESGFAKFEYLIKAPASASVVMQMGDGLMKSPRATKKIKAYYQANKDQASDDGTDETEKDAC